MKIKASGRVALIVATGLLAWSAGGSPANAEDTTAAKSDSATTAKPVRHSRHVAHHKAAKSAEKTAEKSTDKFSDKPAGTDTVDAGSVTTAGMPASVANANAALNATIADADKPSDVQPAAETTVVASDQLNDVDRALQQAAPAEPAAPQPAAEQQAPQAPPQTVAMASAKATPLQASSDSGAWDQTSLIGKIFIGFGALLTMASAARMFMA